MDGLRSRRGWTWFIGLTAAAWILFLAAPETTDLTLARSWRIAGFLPGKGAFEGRMRATAAGADRFELTIEGRYADGAALSGRGVATVYTGYEWRGSVDIDGIALRQVIVRGQHVHGHTGQRGRGTHELGHQGLALTRAEFDQVVVQHPGRGFDLGAPGPPAALATHGL